MLGNEGVMLRDFEKAILPLTRPVCGATNRETVKLFGGESPFGLLDTVRE